ncbi:hypothetical protein [Rheinheimera sp.]|uniref:hypothetical protein n=1 Tax=Rheinheimera sp. TaxID=1869214 RepID=UPI0037C7CE5D
MQTLTAISAYQTKQQNEIVLIDSGRLADWYGLNRDTPKVVCKTSINGSLTAGWNLYIQENNQYIWLLGAQATDQKIDALDVIPLLGHNLLLMPWQKLVFCCKGEYCGGVSYIDLMTMASA